MLPFPHPLQKSKGIVFSSAPPNVFLKPVIPSIPINLHSFSVNEWKDSPRHQRLVYDALDFTHKSTYSSVRMPALRPNPWSSVGGDCTSSHHLTRPRYSWEWPSLLPCPKSSNSLSSRPTKQWWYWRCPDSLGRHHRIDLCCLFSHLNDYACSHARNEG